MPEKEAIKKHPIRAVTRYTAMSAEGTRAWEKRYKVVHPGRDHGNRRLYSDQDIERLILLKQVSEFGRRISEIVHLSTARLKELLREDSLKVAAIRHPICLGETVAVNTICDAVRISGAHAVVIGFGTDSEHFQTPNHLRHLKFLLPATTPLIA